MSVSSMMSRTTISMTTTSLQPSTTQSTSNSSKNSGLISSSGSGGQSEELSTDEMIEMLKNLAALKEKQHKWEQSVKKLEKYANNNNNKSLIKDIIDFIDNDKSSTQDKAIYLYGQLAHKCHQQKNFMGAAKAYERAATLRFDNPNALNENNSKDTKTTIQYLESAIVNYDAIHKYRHAGTLHYRCSRILRLMNASADEVAKHYCQALEYFTMRNHEVKHRKRIDGLKISCYSSSNNYKRKWDCNQRCCRDIDYFVASKYSRYINDCDSNRSTDNEDSQTGIDITTPQFMTGKDYIMSAPSGPKSQDIFSMDTELVSRNGMQHNTTQKESIISITQHNQTLKQQNRCIEDRIESAKKLVKKLHKVCPFYEVSADGEDAGRVFCKICERHLGAVSSTLKNHVNTQEHKQAVEDSMTGSGTNDCRDSKMNAINISRPIGAIKANINQLNAIQGYSSATNSNTFDFESFDIQWVPGFQSPNTLDYNIPTGPTGADINNQNNSNNCMSIIPSKTITNL